MEGICFFGLKADQDFDELPTEFECTFTDLEATLPAGTNLADFFIADIVALFAVENLFSQS